MFVIRGKETTWGRAKGHVGMSWGRSKGHVGMSWWVYKGQLGLCEKCCVVHGLEAWGTRGSNKGGIPLCVRGGSPVGGDPLGRLPLLGSLLRGSSKKGRIPPR